MGTNDIPQSNTKFLSADTREYAIDSQYDYIYVNTSQNAVRVFLPNIHGAGLENTTKKFYIVDMSGNAATNNITIYPSGSDTLNGSDHLTISVNKGSAECAVAGPNAYVVTGNMTPDSGLSATLVNDPGAFSVPDTDNALQVVINDIIYYIQLVQRT